MRNLLFMLLLVAGLLVVVSVSPVQAGEEKVYICHVAPTKKGTVILVNSSAIPGHLSHGDWGPVDPNSIFSVGHCEQGEN